MTLKDLHATEKFQLLHYIVLITNLVIFGFAATSVLYPIFWIVWEVLYAPIRLVLGLANLIAFACESIYEMLKEIWEFVSSIIQLASASEASVTTYEVSIWRSLWNDLFSQVLRSAFFSLNA